MSTIEGGGVTPLPLQVTERLLEAEEQKLRLLKTEIEVAKHTVGGHNALKDNKVRLYDLTIFILYFETEGQRAGDTREYTNVSIVISGL